MFKIGDKVIYTEKELFRGGIRCGDVFIISEDLSGNKDPSYIGFYDNQADWRTVQDIEDEFELYDSVEDHSDVDLVKIYKEEPKKYNTGKPMMSLVRPEFQLALAEALTYGYTKYDEKRGDIQNYLKGDGFHYSSIIDSLERHINAFKSGQSFDVGESDLHHLSLAAANLMFLYAYETSDKGIDDRVVLDEKK